MSLTDIKLNMDLGVIPSEVRAFLREAERRVDNFQRFSLIPAFVPSDFERAYHVLQEISMADLATGKLFCEWGSGFGVVTCLAAWLEFDACGIEIAPELVDAARQLADDFDLPVQFACGSFIPRRDDVCAAAADDFAWLTTDGGLTHEELGLAPDDLDLVFAYPWPDEEDVTGKIFDRHAAADALLLTYHGGENFRLRRKKPARRAARR